MKPSQIRSAPVSNLDKNHNTQPTPTFPIKFGDVEFRFKPEDIRFVHKPYKNRHNKGGITVGYLYYNHDGLELMLVQMACCCPKDNYNKRFGREIVLGRMKKYGPSLVLNLKESEALDRIQATFGEEFRKKSKTEQAGFLRLLDMYSRIHAGKMRDYVSIHNEDIEQKERVPVYLNEHQTLRIMEHGWLGNETSKPPW